MPGELVWGRTHLPQAEAASGNEHTRTSQVSSILPKPRVTDTTSRGTEYSRGIQKAPPFPRPISNLFIVSYPFKQQPGVGEDGVGWLLKATRAPQFSTVLPDNETGHIVLLYKVHAKN